MEIVSEIVLNLQVPGYATVYEPQGDTRTRKIHAQLMDGSTPWTIPTGATMVIRYKKPDGTVGFYDTDELGNQAYAFSGNGVTFTLAAQTLTVAGMVFMQLDFYAANSQHLSTFTFALKVTEAVVADGEIASEDYINALTRSAAQITQDLHILYGAPRTANTASAMTDENLVYVYTGTTGGGFTNGHWYYYNGTAWADGGVYNSTAFTTDKTLTVDGGAADAKVVGEKFASVDGVADYEASLANDGVFQITSDVLESGVWNYSKKSPSTTRGRTKYLLPVRAGMQISYANTTFDIYFGTLETPTSYGTGSYIQFGQWYTAASGTLNITVDGYLVFNFRNHADTSATVDVSDFDSDVKIISALRQVTPIKYLGTAPTVSVTELPDNCQWTATGSVMQPLLGANFEWDLTAATTYNVTVMRVSSVYRRYELHASGGMTYWCGGKADASANINWYTMYPDTTLAKDRVPADSKTVGDIIRGNVLVQYIGTAPEESVTELPDNCWWMTSGATLQPLLGPNFVWTLTASVSYVLRKYKISSTYVRYELSGTGGARYWTGGKLSSAENISWYTTEPDTTLSKVRVPADSKTVGDRLAQVEASGGGAMSAKLLSYGHSVATGSVWTVKSGDSEATYDHLVDFDDSPYGGVCGGLGIRPKNVDYTLVSNTGFMHGAGTGVNGFLGLLKSTDITPYDYMLTWVSASRDMLASPVGSLSSTAGDGSIVGGVLDLLAYIKTNNALCQLILAGPFPSSVDYAGPAVYNRGYTYDGVTTTIAQFDELMRQLAEREHFIFIDFEDMALSYYWQNYTAHNTITGVGNVHLASDRAYRIVGEYLRRKVAGA